MKKFVLMLMVAAVSAMADVKTYTVTLFQPTLVGGDELKPGEYKIDVNEKTAVIRKGKQSVESSVTVETAQEKFGATSVRYRNGDGKYRLQEIRFGGTSTKVVFN